MGVAQGEEAILWTTHCIPDCRDFHAALSVLHYTVLHYTVLHYTVRRSRFLPD